MVISSVVKNYLFLQKEETLFECGSLVFKEFLKVKKIWD